MNSITNDDLIAILGKMADDLEGAKDFLGELDAAVGDGDQGVTMTIGFRAIRDVLPSLKGQDAGTIIARAGMTFNGKAASTIGALIATAGMRAGKEVKGKTEIDLADLVKMVDAAIVGIKERGKADVGDKTVLDMLAPTLASLQSSVAEDLSLAEALKRSVAAAEAGAKSTIPMKSKIGRASWLADRTVGHQDPGATSFYLMWKSMAEYVIGQE
jgi:dihydroxyacetone kinase-like protein